VLKVTALCFFRCLITVSYDGMGECGMTGLGPEGDPVACCHVLYSEWK
jgi:hypothetical protein